MAIRVTSQHANISPSTLNLFDSTLRLFLAPSLNFFTWHDIYSQVKSGLYLTSPTSPLTFLSLRVNLASSNVNILNIFCLPCSPFIFPQLKQPSPLSRDLTWSEKALLAPPGLGGCLSYDSHSTLPASITLWLPGCLLTTVTTESSLRGGIVCLLVTDGYLVWPGT